MTYYTYEVLEPLQVEFVHSLQIIKSSQPFNVSAGLFNDLIYVARDTKLMYNCFNEILDCFDYIIDTFDVETQENEDEAPIFPNSLFKNNEEKENYETKLMFSFRKYQAAQYHFQNVIKYLKKEEDNIIFIKEDRELVKKSINVSGTIELPANHYVYELSAFLEAMKSSIDFLATLASFHLKGIQFDKISSLMKMIRKKRIAPIFNQIKNHYDWLSYLRKYRHHLVHRLIINISKEYKTLKIYNSIKTYARPIIIPEESPKYVPDTRRSRMHDMGSSDKFGKLEIKTQFGNESVTTHFQYLPIIGYIPIEKFMEKQLIKFKQFFNDFINVLASFEFKQV